MAKKDLNLSLVEAFFSSLMIGAGEVFFGAYALSKGMGELLAGLVIGLPMMMGAGLQTLTPFLFERFGRPKRWVILAACLQAFILFLLMITCFYSQAGAWTVFALIGLYWAFSFSGASVWNFWMGYLIQDDERSHFFASRSRLLQYGTMVGLLIAGFFLREAERLSWGPSAFVLPFLVAFLARCFAVYLMGAQSPVQMPSKPLRDIWGDLLKFFRQSGQIFSSNHRARKDLAFLFLFNAAIYVSSSFVAPFLIAQLKFDAMSFMAAQMALYLGRLTSLSRARRWVDRWGYRQIFFWGALGISPLPAFWYFVAHTWAAIGLQFVSGFFWGLFDVSMNLLLFSELPSKDKIQLLTWNQFFQTLAILIGTLIGAQILGSFGESLGSYWVIFLVGALFRTGLVLWRRKQILNPSVARP